jgi:broad specificity phosphatase PhoE
LRIERVLLVRHGQTDWNVQERWQGYEPVPLNADGWAQARALAAYLRHRPIRAVFSSDLPRAYQTASVIGDVLGVHPCPDERLREFNLGIFQGFTRAESAKKFPNEWSDFLADYWDYPIPNGETRRMMQNRVFAAWEEVVTSSEGPEVVIVSHGGSIKMLLLKLFPHLPHLNDIRLGNTSVTMVERRGQGWHLASVALIDHLATLSNIDSGEASL